MTAERRRGGGRVEQRLTMVIGIGILTSCYGMSAESRHSLTRRDGRYQVMALSAVEQQWSTSLHTL